MSEKLEREAGIRLIRAHQWWWPPPAPVDVARRFGLAAGTPVLMFRRTYYQESGRPAEFVQEYQDSARFPYEEALVRAPR